jgi:hypothetical protein
MQDKQRNCYKVYFDFSDGGYPEMYLVHSDNEEQACQKLQEHFPLAINIRAKFLYRFQ